MIHAYKYLLVLGFRDKLYWNDGSLRFSYVGEKCRDGANYTLDVMLHCDYSGQKKDFLGAFHESESCSAHIFMQTPAACLPAVDNLLKQNCVVKSPSGDVFNFNSLRNYNHKVDGKDGKSFVIGICNPVLYGHQVACDTGASVCMIDSNAKEPKDKYKSVGVMTQDLKYEDNFISLTMTSSEKCSGDKTYSSRIMFECDQLATVSYPTYHSTIDCLHSFSWPTQLACPQKKSCQVSDVDTGVSFDFSSLANVQYEAVNTNNTEEKILFSVCSPAKEPCLQNSGSCVVKTRNNQSTLAGLVNSELKLNGKNPYLLYEGGASCKVTGSKLSTRIDFICADNATDEGAVAIEDGCAITIHFKTMLACEFIKNCVTKTSDDQEIDLRPLIDFEGNYIATVNKETLPKEVAPVQYLLNVCRPLNSKYSLNCHGSAGACRTEIETDGKHEREMSLGHPDYSLATRKVGETYKVTMKYFDGATCPTDKSENVTTKINFFCDEKVGLGNPILQSVDHCEYSFDFPTNILCNELNVEIQNESCSLVNPHTSVMMDLKLFGNNGVYRVGDKDVNLCGVGAEAKFYTIVYKQSLVRIEFSEGSGKGEF
jgi:insulin-like growth factor 2 receptor